MNNTASFETLLKEYYLPLLDKTIKRYFPEYVKKTSGLSPTKRKGIEFLSDEEIVDLHNRYIHHGDYNARNVLVYSQLRLVCHITKEFHYKFNGSTLSAEDLLGFANITLIELIDTYNPHYNLTEKEIASGKINKLPSYIQTWLKFNLPRELKNYGHEITLPHNQILDITNYKKILSKFTNRYGRLPHDMDVLDISTNTETKRAYFNLQKNEVLLQESLDSETWKTYTTIKIHNVGKIMSGNGIVNEEGGELFDFIESTTNIEPYGDNVEDLLKNSISKILSSLEEREQESLKLLYFENKAVKNIPSLLTPDYACVREMKRLKDTSENTITINYKHNRKNYSLVYNIIANHHIESNAYDDIVDSILQPISHNKLFISTTSSSDRYQFHLNGCKITNVIHKTYRSEKKIDYSLENNVLTFNVNYSYGDIFTPQTFINKHEKLMIKLRCNFKNLKKHIYE